mgnify:CR=1 FL=1
MSKVYPLYPTPLYEERIEEPLLSPLQEELLSAYRKMQELGKFEQFPAKPGQYHSVSDATFKKGTLQHFHPVEIFEEVLHINAIRYMKAIHAPQNIITSLENEMYETAIWLTKTVQGKHAIEHSHGDSDISGVYYIQTNNQDGNIYFRSPVKPHDSANSCYSHLTNTNVSITPEVGKLMMFPGWLRHGVRTNETMHDRVSISFNINIELPSGKDKDVDLLSYVNVNNRLGFDGK